MQIFSIIVNFLIILNSALTTKSRPNIVFILADDLGWGDVGIHGSSQVKTPNIDLLAANGVILNNYYVSPMCSPSRAALLTGLHPIHLGLQHDVIYNSQPWGLPPHFTILPQYLKRLGYESHLVGKWHLGFARSQYLPTRRGFDSHFGYWTGHIDYYDMTSGRVPSGYDFRDNENPINISEYKGRYVTDIITEKSIEIILKNAKTSDKPLFLMISHNAVHTSNKQNDPVQVPYKYIKRFKYIENQKRRKFCAMVSSLDNSVGEVMSALKTADKLNETIVIFSTDNGGATRGTAMRAIDNSIGSNWPLRGSKYTLFEGGIRGFAFIWSPLLERNYISDHLMHIQDWLPTIYSAVGGPPQELPALDGIDLWQTLRDNLNSSRQQLLHNIDDIWKVWALRDGDYKLISGSTKHGHFDHWYLPPGELNSSVHRIDYEKSKVYQILSEINENITKVKPIITKCDESVVNDCKPKQNPCLFNIKADPCERHNLFQDEPKIVEKMLKLLSDFNSTAVKPLNKGGDGRAHPKYHQNFWSVWQ